jgi:hypothetical protein
MMLSKKCYVLQSEGREKYKFAVNQYSLVDKEYLQRPPRRVRDHSRASTPITLVLAHALGLRTSISSEYYVTVDIVIRADKETWEPFLEELRTLQMNDSNMRTRGWVTEAWAMDCPSHGDSNILNEHKLKEDGDFHSSLFLLIVNRYALISFSLFDIFDLIYYAW